MSAATQKKLAAPKSMLDTLTSLRFIAAFMVFLWHMHFHFLAPYQLGYVGVGFFYILSGFILTYVYYTKLKVKNFKSIKKFYIARIAKIYPVYLLSFVASLPLVLPALHWIFPYHTKWNGLGLALVNLTFTQSYFPSNTINFSFNGVAWSLSVEMFFYALFPLIILIIARYYRMLTIKKTLFLMAFLWLLLMAFLLPRHAVVDDWIFYIFPPARLPDFVMGILLGAIYMRLPAGGLTRIYNRTISYSSAEILAVALLLIGIIAMPLLPQSVHFGVWLMPFWILLIFIFAQQKGALSRILSHRPLVFLGEISFSFYMTHQLIISYFTLLQLPHAITAVLSLGTATLVSSLVYLLYEEPLRIRLKAFMEHLLVDRRVTLFSQNKTPARRAQELETLESTDPF